MTRRQSRARAEPHRNSRSGRFHCAGLNRSIDTGSAEHSDRPHPPYSTERFADDVVAVLDELAVDRADVYDTSMGGRVAQCLAVRHSRRVRALVLGCTSAGGRHSIDRGGEVRRSLIQPDPVAARQALLELMYTPAWLAMHPGPYHTLGDRSMPAHARRGHLVASDGHDAWDALPGIVAPTQVLHTGFGGGEGDAEATGLPEVAHGPPQHRTLGLCHPVEVSTTRIGPEPVTPDPVHLTQRPLLTQSWLDLAFVHWATDPADVAPFLPAGTLPDTFDGATYIGLVAFRMHRVGWFRLPGIPYLGTFPETNVRLYSVDSLGRRGVVFRSLDASRLIPVAIARTVFRLPYLWSRMSISRRADTISYHSSRRWPGPRGAHSRVTIGIGEQIEEPTALEHFLTARWGMHNSFFGQSMYLPNTHPRWPLHRAELIECDENLVMSAGLPEQSGTPASVLYSPGVPVRFGRPARPGGIPTP